MALLLILPDRDSTPLLNAIAAIDPEIDMRDWPDVGEPRDVDFAVTWNHPAGELKKYPNLKGICSYGAGVDHLLRDPDLPQVPVARIMDDDLLEEIREYLLAVVLAHRRHLKSCWQLQQQRKWHRLPVAPSKNVGVMGLGRLGSGVALTFAALGFNVYGWSRSPKKIKGVTCFSGNNNLPEFLQLCNYLLVLLPLTEQTENLFNADFFQMVKKGAFFVNVGRGQLLDENALLQALDAGLLSAACLDVFRQEPLPASHPFWSHSKISITPHMASITNPSSAARHLVHNYRRLLSGRSLTDIVDPARGY